MNRVVVTAALAVVCMQGAAQAAVSCPDRVPAAVTAVSATGRKCQEAIAREGKNFLKKKMAVLSACKLKRAAGLCPLATDTAKIEKKALKAAEKIAAVCGDDLAQAALTSSYASGTDPAVISSCMLSQHNVVGEQVVANAIGATVEDLPFAAGKERTKCIKQIATSGRLFAAKFLTNASNCIKTQTKKGIAGNLAPICIGSFAAGAFVPPTDLSTAKKQAKLFEKTDAALEKKCAPVASFIPNIFGCSQYADSVAGLQECIACNGFSGALDALETEYSESGSFVANAPGAIQTAVSAASAGDKLLIGSGDYVEEVLITTDNLKIVGCGGATNQRPVIKAPAVEVEGRGLRAANVDGLVFQSLGLFGQDNDGIRVTLCQGVTFRDIVADGDLESAYSVFPQTCNNVLVELCKVTRVNDAPLYIGQSSTIIVRHNEVRDSVAGIEIENCGNAQVYGNYGTGNTGGILVFKDGSLPVQLSQCHDVHHNVMENNNTPNFGSGTVAKVPDGTGMLVISNDTSLFHHNISRLHNTFGIAFTDQVFSEFGPPFSADQDPEENYFYNNVLTGNGGTPDPDIGFGGDGIAVAAVDLNTLDNCESGNAIGDLLTSNLQNLPTCTLPPAAFATCPAPSVP